MKKVMVTYKVKADKAEENKQLIKKVFEELKSKDPGGLRYTSYAKADGVSFVHIASIENEDGSNPLNSTDAFKEFTKNIKDRCEEPPMAVDITEIGSFGF